MKPLLRTVSAFALLGTAPLQAQNFTMDQVQYWIGAGADSSVLVIDFQDGTDHASYAWGWLHNGGTGEDMVNAIAAADPDLIIEVTTGFLNTITYGTHAGIGGSPNYWSTWDGPDLAGMVSNLGLATEVGNGQWFGCSYTDFDPALAPTEPIAASVPTGIHEASPMLAQVYPQPATDVLYLHASAPAQQRITLYDLTGSRVYQGRTTGRVTSIDVRALAPGLYVLYTGEAKRTIVIQ